MAGTGAPILMAAQLKALRPTAIELFDILCEVLFGSHGGGQWDYRLAMKMAPAGECPSAIGTDELSINPAMRGIFKTTGIRVFYYPPPTEEEEHMSKYVGVPVVTGPRPWSARRCRSAPAAK